MGDTLTPLDFVLDICLMQLPKLITVEIMVQYQLPVVGSFFVVSAWGPVFSLLLNQGLVMGLPDMRACVFAKLDACVRNLRTLSVTYFDSDCLAHHGDGVELGLLQLVRAGLMARTQPPSPHTTWGDVAHMLSTCADLASHVRLFSSLGQCVASKATLLGEMLGVACAEHRGLVAREACLVYKLEGERTVADACRLSVPVPGPVFGPCVGWGVRGPDGGNTGDFTRAGCTQSDERPSPSPLWASRDPVSDWVGRSPWSPIGACRGQDQQIAQPEHRARRRPREGDDVLEVRLAPAARGFP
jgi:hypothetical protein